MANSVCDSDSDAGVEEFFGWLLAAHNLLNPSYDEDQLLKKLKGLVTNIKWSPEDVSKLFDALLKRFESTANDRSHLLSWMLEMLHCIEINYITPRWKSKKGETLIELVQDKTATDNDLNICLANNTEKDLDEILEEIRQQKLNHIEDELLEKVRDIVSSIAKNTIHDDGSEQSHLKKVLLKLRQAVEKTHFKHFKPRLTQMVSWCIMALSKTGQLIQVGTGEGKSCIVAMFAAFRALKGEQVDIMTSSPVLAERDLKEWKNFYQDLNISVDCNTNKQHEDLFKECYKCQVVYGTADSFAGHRLSQDFERKDIFGKRKFQCAIVDEVDSLMLDKGNHVVYIGTDMPALQHLNPLLAYIWATANQYTKIGTKKTVGQKYPFFRVVLENIPKGNNVDEFTILQMAEETGLLAKGSVKDLRRNPSLLSEKTASVPDNQLAQFFEAVEKRFPSCQFDLHCTNSDGSIEKLKRKTHNNTDERKRMPLLLISGGLCQYMYTDTESMVKAAEAEIRRALHFTPCEPSQDECSCYVPGFLSDLVNSKLKVWIENAFKAQAMTMGHEYIIESHGIVPVDYSSTGVVENFRTLTDGLQQFLEMKHAKSKLSDMAAITNYMSNVGLFLKYGDQIFGISGTLGQQAETETLQKIYGIKTCQIPLFKRRKLFEVEGVIVDDEEQWIEKICSVITEQTSPTLYRAQRAVLVICETIKRAVFLHQALGDKVQSKKLYVSNNMDNTEIFAQKLEAGHVIIATNLAGRGTDLQVSDHVNGAGGLFIVQTFLPQNARVEAQAFGRTARQGSPGSAQLVICSSHLPESLKLLALTVKLESLFENMIDDMQVYQHLFVTHFKLYHKNHRDGVSESLQLTLSCILKNISDSGMKKFKKVRDDLAAKALASYLQSDIPNIKKKEELFSQYLETLDEVYKSNDNMPADSDLSALNEFWGMWLLTNFKENESTMVLKDKLTQDLKKAKQKLRHKESPLSNLHHFTAFGNELRKKGDVAESIKMYTKAIQEDHCWAAVAYYNRAFVALNRGRRQDSNCIHQALQDLQNALKSVEFYHTQIKATHTYSTQEIKDHGRDSISRFDKHMTARYEMLKSLKGNIAKAIKKLENARDRLENVKVHEKLIMTLIPPQHLFTLAKLQMLVELAPLISSSDHLKIYQCMSHPDFDIAFELQRFVSLGLTKVYTLDTTSSFRGYLSRLFR